MLGSEEAHVRHSLLYSLWIVVLLYCIYQVVLDFLVYSTSFVNTKVLGAKIEWVRELLRFGTGRATLRAFDEPASCLEDDKDGVTVWGFKDTGPNLRSNYDPNPSTAFLTPSSSHNSGRVFPEPN